MMEPQATRGLVSMVKHVNKGPNEIEDREDNGGSIWHVPKKKARWGPL